MKEVLNKAKRNLLLAKQQLTSYRSLSDDEKNVWFGPLVLIAWGIVGMLFGSSEPETKVYSFLQIDEYFSFVGGFIFLLILIISILLLSAFRTRWSRYLVAFLVVGHFIFHVSYVPQRFMVGADGDFGTTDSGFSLFNGSIPASILFEAIPIFAAVVTIRLDLAQKARVQFSNLGGRIATVLQNAKKRFNEGPKFVADSGDGSAVSRRAANRAFRASRVVEAFGWLNIILGVIAGVVLIVYGFQGGDCESFYNDCGTDGLTVGIGFGVMFACIIQGSFFVMIAAYIASRSVGNRSNSNQN